MHWSADAILKNPYEAQICHTVIHFST